jgi:hypothetical protein
LIRFFLEIHIKPFILCLLILKLPKGYVIVMFNGELSSDGDWRLEQEEVENPTLEILVTYLVTYLVSCEAQDSYEQIIAGKKTRQNL